MRINRKRSSLPSTRARLALIFAALGALLMSSGLVVLGATSASADDQGGGRPPGNNGTVKIANGPDIDNGDGIPENQPQVGCTFTVQWFNFDVGTQGATVDFDLQAPTATNHHSFDVTSGDVTPTFAGGTPLVNHGETYTLTFGGPPAAQGFHVKMTVKTTLSQGSDIKHKTFWVEPCGGDGGETDLTIPEEQQPSAPSCSAPGSYVLPADTQDVDWAITPNYTLGDTGIFTVSATARNNKTFTDNTTTKTWQFTIQPQLRNCTDIPPAPVPVAPSCTADGSLTLPAKGNGLDWSITPAYHGVGTYTVTVTPEVGNFSDGTASKEFVVTVAPRLAGTQCAGGGGPQDQFVTPAAPQFANPDCKNLGGATATFADTDGVDYTMSGTPGLGQTVSVNAVAKPGFVFPGNAQTSWSHTYPEIQALDCAEVEGTETAKPGPKGPKPDVNKPGTTDRPAEVAGTQAAIPTGADAGLATMATASSGSVTTVLAQLLVAGGLLLLVTGGCIGLGRRTRGVHEA